MKNTKRFAVRTFVVSALVVAGLFTACDKNEPEPTPGTKEPGGETVTWPKAAEGIANQYQYNGAELVDIKNVVYDYSEEAGAYCLAFSTVEGENSVEGVLKGDAKSVVLVIPTLDGAVDTTKAFGFTLGDGKELSVMNSVLSGKEHSVKISATLKDETHVAVSIEYIGETPDSPYFFLQYDGEAVKEAHEIVLGNQMMREDGTITDIKSVHEIVTHSTSGSFINLCFYDTEADSEEDASALSPALVVAFPDGTKNVDFSTIDQAFIVQAGKDFEYMYDPDAPVAASGSFSLNENATDGTYGFSLDLTVGDKSVKLAYEGGVYVYFSSMNSLEIDFDGTELNPDVNVLFREVKDGKCRLVLGSNEDATTPEELKNGRYAISVTVPSDGLDDEYDISEATDCVVEVYDYQNFTTTVYDGEHLGEDGVIAVYTDPNKDGKNLYLHLEGLGFANGLYVDGDYYGAVTDTEIPDLTPVKPFTPTITITNEDGSQVLFQKTITRMEVCHIKEERDFAGSLITGYLFYFLNEDSESDVDTAKYPHTPLFTLPDYQFNKENVDLYTAKGDGMELCWSLAFNNANLSAGAESTSPAQGTYGYNLMNGYINRLPDEATLTTKRDGKNWDFKLVLKDYGCFTMFDTTTKSGTKNVLTIEWHGPATKYSGTKYTNTLTDQDY